jgi:hypothetical protein
MSSFVKSKKKRKKTLIILALLNPILGVGMLGIHHWYLGDAKKTGFNLILSTAYVFFVISMAEVLPELFGTPSGMPVPPAFWLVYINPTILELFMITFFPNSKYYADIEWVEPTYVGYSGESNE